MKRPSFFIVLVLAFLTFGVPLAYAWFWESEPAVRPAYVAGQFYPDDPAQLKAMVDGFLVQARPSPPPGAVYALIAPHAGYSYSGAIAAQSFAVVKGRHYKRVVILAPSHLESFSYASVYGGEAYTTPLGKVFVDQKFAKALAKESALIKFSDAGHGKAQGRGEHAIEVELPFLQEALGEFKIVPVVTGNQDYEVERALGAALAKLIKLNEAGEPDTLIVASSDLSHFHAYDKALALDRMVLGAIADGDYFSLSANVEARIWEACGGAPVVAAMIASERMGAAGTVELAYANSGDVTGDKESVVGYGAAVLYKPRKDIETTKDKNLSLTNGEREKLLRIAKSSVEAAVKYGKMTAFSGDLSPALQTARGAFVTLKKNGELRGCIGSITAAKPLAETVRAMAVAAATEDPRFPRVKADELGKLTYDISVLSPLRRVTDVNDIRVGRDGLVIRKGRAQGLLLPQVPGEFGWDRLTFLQQTAAKAGLPPQAWKEPDADVVAFTAVVWGDKLQE